jgi:sodium-dependent dicarboxylate transporter 2/3/5
LDSGVRRLKAQVARSTIQPSKNIGALIIFFLVFLGWIFFSEEIGLGIIALTGVILYMVSGLVTWEDLNRNVNWGVIILFGATLSLGTQIYNTGAATWLADKILVFTGQLMESVPIFTDIFVVLMTTILANIISSSATVAVLAPITIKLSGDPIYIGLLTAIASAFGYFTAVAAPACTIIYASGLIKAKDFLKIGWKMGLVSMITVVIYANVYWRFINM